MNSNTTLINMDDDDSNIDWNPEMTALNARLDKLEQELDWTRDMLEIIRESIDDMNSPKSWENTDL
jgi:hypothetical protein